MANPPSDTRTIENDYPYEQWGSWRVVDNDKAKREGQKMAKEIMDKVREEGEGDGD